MSWYQAAMSTLSYWLAKARAPIDGNLALDETASLTIGDDAPNLTTNNLPSADVVHSERRLRGRD